MNMNLKRISVESVTAIYGPDEIGFILGQAVVGPHRSHENTVEGTLRGKGE